ncbi:MAG: YdcF family protein [Colwellia sp.]|nr:YdcF family protein [Colwellia sp.]
MDLFLLKKIISALIMPLSIIIILLILAIIFYQYKKRFSYVCLIAATLLLTLGSFRPFANFVMAPIENQHLAFTRSTEPVDYIVILGCWHTTDPELPATSELGVCSLQRLVEAIRIFRIHPEAHLITSGFAGHDETSNAEKVKEAAMLLGVPESKIIVESFPKDTEEEAELIAPRVTGRNVVLITNSDHMPRAIKYFQQQGVYPIAAPAGKWVKGNSNEKNWPYYLPRPSNLEQTTHAWYESLGRFVQWLKS